MLDITLSGSLSSFTYSCLKIISHLNITLTYFMNLEYLGFYNIYYIIISLGLAVVDDSFTTSKCPCVVPVLVKCPASYLYLSAPKQIFIGMHLMMP